MARHHDWGKWTPTEVVLTNGLSNDERERVENELVPLIKRGRVQAIQYRDGALRLDGEKRRQMAYFLRDKGGYSELQIEATISRFQGFSNTTQPDEQLLRS